jgi:hypothetical protein
MVLASRSMDSVRYTAGRGCLGFLSPWFSSWYANISPEYAVIPDLAQSLLGSKAHVAAAGGWETANPQYRG